MIQFKFATAITITVILVVLNLSWKASPSAGTDQVNNALRIGDPFRLFYHGESYNGDAFSSPSSSIMLDSLHQPPQSSIKTRRSTTILNQESDLQADGDHHQGMQFVEHGGQHEDSEPMQDRILPGYTSLGNSSNGLPEKLLSRELVRKSCHLYKGVQRRDSLNSTYLTSCNRYKLENLLSNEILMSILHQKTENCERILNEFIELDELIDKFDSLFKKLLTRYNCHNGYSVKWTCDDCKRAYKDWLCATTLPFYMNGERIKPCISFCERVEQRCPYLHPITREQYGGQPVFICIDPNIPFVPEITPDIPYNEPGKCYDLCHLSDNLTELITDSLSKYEIDKCPDKKSIAEEVRDDPYYYRTGGATIFPNKHETDTTADPNLDDDGDDGRVRFTTATNQTHGDSKMIISQYETKLVHVHEKKMAELREALAIYKNQPKVHHFGHHSDHSSVELSQSTSPT